MSIFVPIAHAGWRPVHQGMKSRSCGLVQRIGTADSATPYTPTPAGDKPPRYIFSFCLRPSVYNSRGSARGEPASRFIGGHIFVPMTRREILVSAGNDIVGDGSRWRGRKNPSAYRDTEPVAGLFRDHGSANVAMV